MSSLVKDDGGDVRISELEMQARKDHDSVMSCGLVLFSMNPYYSGPSPLLCASLLSHDLGFPQDRGGKTLPFLRTRDGAGSKPRASHM
jgi:hypothetical protein